MMLKEIKDTIECDVLGNDQDYIKRLDFKDRDYYNLSQMVDVIKSKVSSEVFNEFALACALRLYCIQEGKVDDDNLEELLDDLDDHIDEKMYKAIYDPAYEWYKQRLKEEEEEDANKKCSSNS